MGGLQVRWEGESEGCGPGAVVVEHKIAAADYESEYTSEWVT